MTEQEINIVAEMHRAGRSHAEIQKATGFGYTKVVRAVVIARKAGIVPPARSKHLLGSRSKTASKIT